MKDNLVKIRKATTDRLCVVISFEICEIPATERHDFFINRVKEIVEITYEVYNSTDAFIQNAFYLAELSFNELITEKDHSELEKYNNKLHEREVQYERDSKRRRNSNG